MDSTVVKKTQETLGKVIKKPPLTEKLLSKPPFRFLHDIVTEVIKANGFFKGLFKTEELNSANVKDRDAKIAFLQKAIDVVVFVTGESLSVRPSKVVAGHEPEKTNEFLQLLGKACLKKLDSQEGIKKVLSGEKPGSGTSSKRKESRTKSSKDKDKEKLNEKENKPAVENGVDKDTVNEDEPELRKKSSSSSRVHSSDKIKHKEKDSKERETKEKTREKSKERDKGERDGAKSGKDKKESKEKLVTSKSEVVSNGDLEVPSDIAMVADGNMEGEDDAYNRNIPRPSSAKGQRRRPKNEDGEDSDEDLDEGEHAIEQVDKTDSNENIELNGLTASPPPARRKLARPSSARPAPPRKKRQQEEQEDAIAKIGPTTQVSNVIVDNKDDEEDDTFLVEEAPAPSINQDITHTDESDPVEDGTDGEHGALVKKMLETKKELEGTSKKSKQDISAKPLMNDAHRRKQREHAQKEIDKLRESIQTLCRSANPLGKIMDYIQEDMDSMQKELEMWREENKQHQIALKREQSITENEIEPLKSHLTNMETDVTEMLDRISTVKCNILRNEEKIQTLLAGVSFS